MNVFCLKHSARHTPKCGDIISFQRKGLGVYNGPDMRKHLSQLICLTSLWGLYSQWPRGNLHRNKELIELEKDLSRNVGCFTWLDGEIFWAALKPDISSLKLLDRWGKHAMVLFPEGNGSPVGKPTIVTLRTACFHARRLYQRLRGNPKGDTQTNAKPFKKNNLEK